METAEMSSREASADWRLELYGLRGSVSVCHILSASCNSKPGVSSLTDSSTAL